MSPVDFSAVRREVLALHRELVEVERRDYERAHGRLGPAELLHHLLHDATFAWLKPLTTVIARMDEAEELDEPAEAEEAKKAVIAELRDLLRAREDGNDFQRRYAALLQIEPGLALSHGRLNRSISV